jgi:predicted lipid-binding transport protein (Tim44 family)
LIVLILFVREGIYFRLRQRIWPSALVFGGSLLGQILTGLGDQLITQAAFAMLMVLAVLLLPNRVYDRLPARSRAPLTRSQRQTSSQREEVVERPPAG